MKSVDLKDHELHFSEVPGDVWHHQMYVNKLTLCQDMTFLEQYHICFQNAFILF